MAYRKYDTCFFERYAMLQLQTLLGHKFDDLVNRDRPDLQSVGSNRLGIEVTRAMEGGREAALQMLKDISGITKDGEDNAVDFQTIVESGYGYGLRGGSFIGGIELDYWKSAQPMKDIISNKVSKVSSGFYGDFDEFGLFVFSKEHINVINAFDTVQYTLNLQRTLDMKYSRLYISAISDFYACNLEDRISPDFRITPLKVDELMRRSLFLSALRPDSTGKC